MAEEEAANKNSPSRAIASHRYWMADASLWWAAFILLAGWLSFSLSMPRFCSIELMNNTTEKALTPEFSQIYCP
ncbi:MAG: hypothetical protein NTX50_02140 [Candidatus Sumerlaeota bacterium]|nr:hypothetical protein [Candidatus Sumerlaeota bacterium]